MSPLVVLWVGVVTLLWVGIVAGVWTLVSVSDEYPPEVSSAPDD